MNLTISRRQNKLYQLKGFDLQRWESLTDEANALRKEIKAVAREYDVDWDEKVDERDEKVTEALKEITKIKNRSNKTASHRLSRDGQKCRYLALAYCTAVSLHKRWSPMRPFRKTFLVPTQQRIRDVSTRPT